MSADRALIRTRASHTVARMHTANRFLVAFLATAAFACGASNVPSSTTTPASTSAAPSTTDSSASSSPAPSTSSSTPTPASSSAGATCYVDLSQDALSNTPDCLSCAKSSCDSQASAAWGSGYSTGDFCSGGACGSFMACMNGCKADSKCEDGCAAKMDATCKPAFDASNACIASSCQKQCGG
jgi:hypothetical protein